MKRDTKSSVKDEVLIPLETWTSWHPDSLVVPFKGDAGIGLGCGERRIEKSLNVIGIKAKPKSTSHVNSTADITIENSDMLDGDWEVKEIGPDSLVFRAGVNGANAAYDVTRAVVDLTDEIERAMTTCVDCDVAFFMLEGFDKIKKHRNKPKNKKEAALPDEHPSFQEVLSAIREINSSAKSGNISKGRVFGDTAKSRFGLQQITQVFISPDLDFPRIKELTEKLAAAWGNITRASVVFKHVIGIIVTNEADGYAMIFNRDLDKYIRFEDVSKGLLRYKMYKKNDE